MISNFNNINIVGEILFSQSLSEIRQQLELCRKDSFDPTDRIVIKQDTMDEYLYTDGVGTKLIELQKIINRVDISNCFILFVTANTDIAQEIDFITQFYSTDPNPIEFLLVQGNYKKTVKKYQNTACQKLWNHFYVGTDGNTNPCCRADHRFPIGNINHEHIDDIVLHKAEKIRFDMKQGRRNRACSACYEREDRGIRSARQSCNPHDQLVRITDLDIRLNNICNFKCRMCSEYFSSAIQQETVELYGKNTVLGFENILPLQSNQKNKNQQLEKILSFITPSIESIYFAGGEPLLTAEHYAILDHLIKIKNTNLKISYNTNLSVLSYKQSSVIEKWHQFTDVTVGASIDASGAVAEYMRHGTVWSDIVANIHAIKKQAPRVKLNIASVVSFATIENLINLQNSWIDQQLFSVDDFRINVLTSPIFLSPSVLPQHHKDRLSPIIRKHIQRFHGTELAKQWSDVLQWMNNNNHTFALKDFAQRTSVLDSHRNESFEKIFSEFKDLL